MEALASAGAALITEQFAEAEAGDEAAEETEAISIDAHVAFVKWCVQWASAQWLYRKLHQNCYALL